jgi:hypothetical protein
MDEIVPLKNMAALALAQHLYRSARKVGTSDSPKAAASEFQDRIRALSTETSDLAEQNRIKADQLETLNRELETLDRNSREYQQELERVKSQLFALEEQPPPPPSTARGADPGERRRPAYELQRTIGFMKEVFQVLGEEYDSDEFSRTMVTCSANTSGRALQSDEARRHPSHPPHRGFPGVDPAVAEQVRVRLRQGSPAGRSPSQAASDAGQDRRESVQHTHQTPGSGLFVSVPMVFNSSLAAS